MTTYKVIEHLTATAESRASVFGKEDSSVILAREMAAAVKALNEHAEALGMALEDAITTFREDDKTVLVTAERQEAWVTALAQYRASFFG